MSLDASLAIASSGIANVGAQLAVVSQNVSNADTAGYDTEIGTQSDVTAEGYGYGVRTGPATLDVSAALQAGVWSQNAAVSGLQTQQTALQAIDGVLGTVGSGTDLASLLGALQTQFATLADDPSNATQQAATVQAAQTLANGINQLSAAYTQQRQAAQDAITSQVATLNSTLADVGALNAQIVQLQAQGRSTADLQNQRSNAIGAISQIVDVKALAQPDGSVTLIAGGGVSLPTTGGSPFAAPSATVGPQSAYPGAGLPAVTLNGADVTQQLSGGSLGADIALRDDVLPTGQAQLDEFAETLATRFDAQGLTLFTQPDGTVPPTGGAPAQAGYVGFASSITVNPAVVAQPSDVRDGTHDTAGPNPFTVNPPGGPAGFTGLTSNILDYTFGSDSSPGVAQPAVNVTGLGPLGNLSAPYAAPADLATQAADLVTAQSQVSGAVTGQLNSATALQTTLAGNLSGQTSVNVDSQLALMTELQNAYGANAKVLSAAQSMYAALFAAIEPAA